MAAKAEEFVPGGAGKLDIYLSPHSDDACFSLGHLARRRGAGMLCTVFTITGYRAGRRKLVADEVRGVTRMRMAEDALFAQACGLTPQWLRLPDAFAREHPPFDAAPAAALARDISEPVLRAILGPTVGRVPRPRPWLFCPAGIGGHVDHLALTMLVLGQLEALSPHYRIAFYEDLHYASKADRRRAGIDRLKSLAAGRSLARRVIPMADAPAQSAKMDLVRLFASQLTPEISSLQAYVPATQAPSEPHEAVWVLQDEVHQRPG